MNSFIIGNIPHQIGMFIIINWPALISYYHPKPIVYFMIHSRIFYAAATAAKLLQLCPTLCDPIDGSPPDFPASGILQARTLEWVAISFSNAWKWKVKVKLLSCARLSATPWTAAYQAPPSMGFSRQEYWSGVPLPSATGLDKYIPIFLDFQWGYVQINPL